MTRHLWGGAPEPGSGAACARVRRSMVIVGCVLGLIAVASRVEAQAVYGSLGGTVTDNSGAVLPGATVTITNVDRKTVDSVVTNDSGFFTKDRLLPGAYEVKAELSGFKTAIVPRVTVSVDTQTPVSFKLELGAVSEEVTVTGGAPLLKTDRADVATTFDSRQLTELPVLDRNLTKFVLLTPGTQQLGLAACGQREPAGVGADSGERPALQRHGLSARWHREPRSHPRHHCHQLDAGVGGRDQDHVAELRRRVRPGDGRRRLDSDEVGHERAARQRVRVLARRQVPGAEPVHAVPARSADRSLHSRDLASTSSVRRSAGRS